MKHTVNDNTTRNVSLAAPCIVLTPKPGKKTQILTCNVHIPASEHNEDHFVKIDNIQIS